MSKIGADDLDCISVQNKQKLWLPQHMIGSWIILASDVDVCMVLERRIIDFIVFLLFG